MRSRPKRISTRLGLRPGEGLNTASTARVVINHPEQMGITQEPGEELEQKQKGLKQRWIEEYELASKSGPGGPYPQAARRAVESVITRKLKTRKGREGKMKGSKEGQKGHLRIPTRYSRRGVMVTAQGA